MGEISLEKLLESRENRVEYQKILLDGCKLPLISFTVNMPGPEKLTPASRYVFEQGVREIRERLAGRVMYSKQRVLDTGCEGFFAVEIDARLLKKITAQIEENHGLGRLFDIDVLDSDGRQISRESVGFSGRKCLLCGEIAAVCARARAHKLEELLGEIGRIIENYREGEGAERI